MPTGKQKGHASSSKPYMADYPSVSASTLTVSSAWLSVSDITVKCPSSPLLTRLSSALVVCAALICFYLPMTDSLFFANTAKLGQSSSQTLLCKHNHQDKSDKRRSSKHDSYTTSFPDSMPRCRIVAFLIFPLTVHSRTLIHYQTRGKARI